MDIWRGTHDDAWESVQQELAATYLSDGLPLVPPTAERVRAMLAANGYKRDEEIALVAPSFAMATAGDIAICAVLAGCKTEYFPVLVAAVDALADPLFNLLGVATTTGSATPIYIVSGPIAARIGLNGAGNVLGSGHRANATIGRAMTLILQNICGAKPGDIDMATLGQPAKYACCFAENSAENPWPPLHVERGFAADTSVVMDRPISPRRLRQTENQGRDLGARVAAGRQTGAGDAGAPHGGRRRSGRRCHPRR